MNQFRRFVINEFRFLEQFGYKVLENDNINLVRYNGTNNEINITFSTIGYELTCIFIDHNDNYFTCL